MSLKNLDTPCIGICSTVYGDEICLGCKRTCQEVIDWNTYQDEQKSVVYDRLSQQIEQAMEGVIIVDNEALLFQQVEKFNIRFREDESPLCLAFHLLREGHDRIKDLSKYGIQCVNFEEVNDLTALFEAIDQKVLNLAEQA